MVAPRRDERVVAFKAAVANGELAGMAHDGNCGVAGWRAGVQACARGAINECTPSSNLIRDTPGSRTLVSP